MTRINAGIEPYELPNKLLLAELREIKRCGNVVSKGKYCLKGAPKAFKLGTGHVKFFYDKGLYTLNRYRALYNEAKDRGLNVTDFSSAWNDYPKELMNDWIETNNARELLKERINNRGFKLLDHEKSNSKIQIRV